jgi:hypothetical protein
LSFLFFLLQNQRTGEQKKSCPVGRAGSSGSGEVMRKGVGGKECLHMYVNAKMIPVESTLGTGGREG